MIPKFRIWSNDLKEMYVQSDLLITLSHSGIDVVHFDSFYEFKDYVLMQTTGLTDKNGKEIFEGDILKSPYGFIGKVNIVEGAWYVQHKDFTNNHFLYVAQGKSEIIGNIHEHSHLLDNGGQQQ